MKRVVVTGATSMIGIALIKECIKNNVSVLAISRKSSINLDRLPKSDLIEIYESNLDELNKIIISKSYDVFYHFAWADTSKINRDNPILQERNIKYTLDAVELANRLGCKKFIGAGSQAEYGPINKVITPKTYTSPRISYGIAKYAAGKLSEKRCKQLGMDYVWGRIFSVYGRYDNEQTMLSYAINQFLKNEPAKFSAATQFWDYLHEEDAGKIFFLLGEIEKINGVYCIANGNSRLLKDYILELKECFGCGAICEFAKESENDNIISLQADISDLIKAIHYIPQISFKQGISDMIMFRKQLFNERSCLK